MLRTRTIPNISKMCGLSIHTRPSNMIQSSLLNLNIGLLPCFSPALKTSSCGCNRIFLIGDLCRFHMIPPKRHQYGNPSSPRFRKTSSSASGQSAERDETCTGYICEKREVGLCACSNDRAKRDRERRKLSPDEIKVSKITTIEALYHWGFFPFTPLTHSFVLRSCRSDARAAQFTLARNTSTLTLTARSSVLVSPGSTTTKTN
jgi:hypothetical protein